MNRLSLVVTTVGLVVLLAWFVLPAGASGHGPTTPAPSPTPSPTACPRPTAGPAETDLVLLCLARRHA